MASQEGKVFNMHHLTKSNNSIQNLYLIPNSDGER